MYRTTIANFIALSTIMFEIKRFCVWKSDIFLFLGIGSYFWSTKVRTQSAKTNTKHQTNDEFRSKQLFLCYIDQWVQNKTIKQPESIKLLLINLKCYTIQIYYGNWISLACTDFTIFSKQNISRLPYACFCTHFVFRISYIYICDRNVFQIFDVFDLVGVFFNRMKPANWKNNFGLMVVKCSTSDPKTALGGMSRWLSSSRCRLTTTTTGRIGASGWNIYLGGPGCDIHSEGGEEESGRYVITRSS